MSLAKEGKFEYKPYMKDSPAYIEMINKHIKDRLIRFEILNRKDTKTYKFCKEKFPKILKELEDNVQIKE